MTEQTVRLISDLQVNNAEGAQDAEAGIIPYLVAADQEGGAVARLSMGTRGTGSMAIGATGDKAGENALETGRMFGEELASLGINVNLGPCIDVITDLSDQGMSTRVFSDDPQRVADLGLAYKAGVDESSVITTYKHFPGAGDGSDYPTSIPLTLDQLREGGLSAYAAAIGQGAEMVMTSATTFPKFDQEQLMADGKTKGYYPATLSSRIVTDMLRGEYGFDGVVITDALDMEQFVTEPDTGKALFAGEAYSVEHDLQVAEKAINAGCDILLIPTDLCKKEAIAYYDDYIAGIVKKVEEGTISQERIDESVSRILQLKGKHGILDMDTSGTDVDQKIAQALEIVGSDKHHEAEKKIAGQSITLLKNDGVLPLTGKEKKVVIIGRTDQDAMPINYAIDQLMEKGIIDPGARIVDRIRGENKGDEKAATTLVIDRYFSPEDGGKLLYSDKLTQAIKGADAVLCLSTVTAGIDRIQDASPSIQGVQKALADSHKAGAKFILLSDSLPVDTIRFQEADAIVCAYLAAGFDIDPTSTTTGSENVGAFNANVPAAITAIFGDGDMPGTMPVNLPELKKGKDGKLEYSDKILYQRGFSVKGK